MKDAARLLAYFAGVILFGAIIAPFLFWGTQWLNAHGQVLFLQKFGFESFFHRALLIGALLLLWPLLRALKIKRWSDLDLAPNKNWARHIGVGLALAAVPLLCCAAVILHLHIYSLRETIAWPALISILLAAIFVPLIEETFFRGLVLGVLLRGPRVISILATSALFSILHFLKAPEQSDAAITFGSGFVSLANSFAQFREPVLVLAGFTTLFLIGVVLADARIATRSLWLPIGLHAGWILASGAFNKIAHREMNALPWLGRNLLVGIVPLALALFTWALLRIWLNYGRAAKA